jgi:hypothetical protein
VGPVSAPANPKLYQGYLQEIVDLTTGGFRFRLDLDPAMAVALIGELQLALRHPGNPGNTAKLGREIIDALRRQFPASCTAIHEVILLGFKEEAKP